MRTLASIAIAAALVLGGTTTATAGGYEYDWKSGNSYSWRQDSTGNTQVRGFNSRTGSTWSTTIEPDGDMRGLDSRGNMWRYDDSTNIYQNYGTGKTCVGEGMSRTCY